MYKANLVKILFSYQPWYQIEIRFEYQKALIRTFHTTFLAIQ